MKNTALKKSVLAASFVAIAVVVGMIQIPWPPAPFLSLDFSEVIILACLITLGFRFASITIILRSAVRLLMGLTTTAGTAIPYFGEVVALIASFSIIVAYFIITKITKTSHRPLIDFKEEEPERHSLFKNIVNISFVATIFTIVMVLFNYFIAIPINTTGGAHIFVKSYVEEFYNGNYWAYTTFLIPIVLPFNLVKIVITMIIFEPVHYGLRLMEIDESPTRAC